MKLTYRILDGAAGACARFEADFPNKGDEEDHARASEARIPLLQAAKVVKHGGAVIVFTKAELIELRRAFGNSTSDPGWIREWATNKKALLSVAEKLGEIVMIERKRRSFR